MQWIGRRKARALDVFRGIDREQAGRVTQRQFIASVLASSACLGWAAGLGTPWGFGLANGCGSAWPSEALQGMWGSGWMSPVG